MVEIIPASRKYIPRIEVLRAIAVMGVMLYHLGLLASSGFLGVDCFFTISGYLICSQILASYKAGEFSFGAFYSRRIKRLFPSLLACLLFCFTLAFVFLNDSEFAEFLKSLSHAILSLANLYFKNNVGYFKAANSQSPLLHTWSLSVEEQFYFFFPLILISAIKISGKRLGDLTLVSIILVLLGISAVASQIYYVDNYQMSLFYLAQFRSFQFLIGAYIAIVGAPRQRSSLVFTGVLTVLLLILCAPKQTNPFSILFLQATTSIVTAVLIFLSGPSSEYLAAVKRIFTALGRRSYSLYLFHWPIIVFYKKLYHVITLDAQGVIWCLGSTFLLAEINYAFVEEKFRYAKIPAQKTIGLAIVIAVASFFSTQYFEGKLPSFSRFNNHSGLRLAPEIKFDTWKNMNALSSQSVMDISRSDARKKIIFIGDSQVADVVNLAMERTRRDPNLNRRFYLRSFMMPVHCGTLYFPNDASLERYLSVDKRVLDDEDPDNIQRLCQNRFGSLAHTELSSYDVIVVANFWYEYQLDFLDYSFTTLRKQVKPGAKVVIIGNKDTKMDILDMVERCEGLFFQSAQCTPLEINRIFRKNLASVELNAQIRRIAEKHGFTFVDPYDAICSLTECTAVTDSSPTYYDVDHFTKAGIEKFYGSDLTSQIF